MIKIVQEGPVLDKMRDITDKVSKAGNTARNAIINTKNTIDYLKGNRDTRFSYNDKGTVRDVRNTALKAYASEAGDWKIDKDSVNGMLRVQFDAKKVSTNLANRVNPSSDRSDSLANYITGYDRNTNIVTMEVPLDNGASAKKKAQKKLDKKKKESFNCNESFNESSDETPLELALQSFETGHWYDRDDFDRAKDYKEYREYMDLGPSGFYEEYKDELDFDPDFASEYGNEYDEGLVLKDTEESVMTPTPVPYKGEVCDEDGKLIKKESLELKTESEDLLETPGLTLSVPEVVTDPKSGDSLVIKINGKEYKYVLPETSDKSVSDVARTVTGIQKHSEGKALAYLKKNMKLVTEAVDLDDDEVQDEIVKSVIRDVNKKGLDVNSDRYVNEIESSLKDKGISTDADYLGSMIVDVMNESKNLFKDNHICQGCGNPLSQCTCKVKDEDVDFDSLEEDTRHLGDEVTWNGSTYIIIDDSDPVVLRPKDKFKDSDFDSPELGDTSEDIYLTRYQLGECTQPSSVGQYKSDSIDLINEDIISEDSSVNKDLVKNLMNYSEDEIKKAMNQISDVKSSYKNLDKRFEKLTGPNTGTFPDGHPWMSLYLASNRTEISIVTNLEENSDDIYVTVDYDGGVYYAYKSFDFYTDLDSAVDLANALADRITDDMSETSVAKVCEDLGLD